MIIREFRAAAEAARLWHSNPEENENVQYISV